jgi:hypothetical protein
VRLDNAARCFAGSNLRDKSFELDINGSYYFKRRKSSGDAGANGFVLCIAEVKLDATSLGVPRSGEWKIESECEKVRVRTN